MIREALTKIVLGDDLSQNEASEVMKEIMEGEVTPVSYTHLTLPTKA